MNEVAGKVALVTGAASGIGAATAALLLREGASLLATDIDARRGEEFVRRLEAAHPGHLAFAPHDVADEPAWMAAIETVRRRFGRLDILVNNAAVMPAMIPLEETSLAEWRRVMAVNLDGVFLGVKHGIAAMKSAGGAIVNVSSAAALVGMPISGAYGPSKAGVHLLTKCAALECAHFGYQIRVNSVHPGYIDTPMAEAIAATFGADQFERRVAKTVPLRRLGATDDIAEAILYLASDRAKFATGSALVIDGGWTAQ
jgi:NAD(P)-dependent dehydrogenase (short-subunit alcohol dehydrogenase family)